MEADETPEMWTYLTIWDGLPGWSDGSDDGVPQNVCIPGCFWGIAGVFPKCSRGISGVLAGQFVAAQMKVEAP